MKTEHACAYLPNKLVVKVIDFQSDYVGREFDVLIGVEQWSKDEKHWRVITAGGARPSLDRVKPILRPLSDLTKEITNDGETFVPIEQLVKPEINVSVSDIKIVGHFVDFRGRALMKLDYYWMYHRHVQTLLSWRFDIFNLIESGEAIDVNTLAKNPYE